MYLHRCKCRTQIHLYCCAAQKQWQGNNTLNLPVELLGQLPCVVGSVFWLSWADLVESLRLSWFMLSKQASALRAGRAEEVALLWCTALLRRGDRGLDKVAEVLNVLEGPDCPDSWDVLSVAFPWDFAEPLVESTLLFNAAGCLIGFAFWVFRRALHPLLSGWTAWVPVLDSETVRGCWFSVATLELLGWDRLKGIGLVHGFFFLAFPCRKIILLYYIYIYYY